MSLTLDQARRILALAEDATQSGRWADIKALQEAVYGLVDWSAEVSRERMTSDRTGQCVLTNPKES